MSVYINSVVYTYKHIRLRIHIQYERKNGYNRSHPAPILIPPLKKTAGSHPLPPRSHPLPPRSHPLPYNLIKLTFSLRFSNDFLASSSSIFKFENSAADNFL